mmetsp:Transcript_22635/g.10905  ORF Transcript_22635/g.10905 Transcript_22635/m.10905 type:complete len:201 (-) Transcript_22635:2638-3240(-)
MKLLSYAKINLFLKVLRKRNDGYHEIETLMCRIGLFDTISISFDTEEDVILCSHPNVPEDESNLALKAARLFFDYIKKNEHIKIIIKKRIPVGAGLGGGSSNAASVLLGLNKYYGVPFSIEELKSIGLQLGVDVPFFIHKRSAIAKNIGEKLSTFEALYPFYVVIIYPGFEVSTKWVYENFNVSNNLRLTNKKKENRVFF